MSMWRFLWVLAAATLSAPTHADDDYPRLLTNVRPDTCGPLVAEARQSFSGGGEVRAPVGDFGPLRPLLLQAVTTGSEWGGYPAHGFSPMRLSNNAGWLIRARNDRFYWPSVEYAFAPDVATRDALLAGIAGRRGRRDMLALAVSEWRGAHPRQFPHAEMLAHQSLEREQDRLYSDGERIYVLRLDQYDNGIGESQPGWSHSPEWRLSPLGSSPQAPICEIVLHAPLSIVAQDLPRATQDWLQSLERSRGQHQTCANSSSADFIADRRYFEALARLMARPWAEVDEAGSAPGPAAADPAALVRTWASTDPVSWRTGQAMNEVMQVARSELADHYVAGLGFSEDSAVLAADDQIGRVFRSVFGAGYAFDHGHSGRLGIEAWRTDINALTSGAAPVASYHLAGVLRQAIMSGASLEQVRRLQEFEIAQRRDAMRRHRPDAELTPLQPVEAAVLNLDVLDWLLASGADPDQRNSFGKTPLMTAAHLDQPEAVRRLLAGGADIHARMGEVADLPECAFRIERRQRTALMYAAENAGPEVLALLLEAGADILAEDSHGQGVWAYLARNRDRTSAELEVMRGQLVAAGAPVPPG